LDLFSESDLLSNYAEENTYSAAFAVAPYLIAAAQGVQPEVQFWYIRFLAMVVMYRSPAGEEPMGDCPPDLEDEFRGAVAAALGMAAGLLPALVYESDVRWLLAAIAAFKGFPGLARGIVEIQHEQRPDEPSAEIPF
jgi:hypothetical protein